jgi:flagellin-like protein
MKILRSRKALSPVVASIILIAVTVAVSIAVAAWMGALTFNFMATEQGQITYMTFTSGNPGIGYITTTFNNTGTTKITINSVYVNGVQQANYTQTPIGAVAGNSGVIFVIYPTQGVVSGAQYEVKLISAAGHTFSSVGTAPS